MLNISADFYYYLHEYLSDISSLQFGVHLEGLEVKSLVAYKQEGQHLRIHFQLYA